MLCIHFNRCSVKVVPLAGTANNMRPFNLVNGTNNNKKSKFLEMDEQEHQVMHYYKPKPYENDVKPPAEDDQQLKRHLSLLSSDSIVSTEPSVIDMHENEAERFLRSMQILLSRREIMDEQLGYHPSRHFSQPTAYDKTSIQALANGVPPLTTLAFDQSPQKIFAAPNRDFPVTDDSQSVMERKQTHPLLVQPTHDDNNTWNDIPTIMAYPDTRSTTQSTRCTVPSHGSSIQSLEISEQL